MIWWPQFHLGNAWATLGKNKTNQKQTHNKMLAECYAYSANFPVHSNIQANFSYENFNEMSLKNSSLN